ncbi:MAG: hypothetical protein A2977_03605 [Alphaproteobacteria bacterium RIFCSPLOWO2_01_FULL_45_8]|nr:MAG: hypothetical protein A3K20_00345 [Alphaproteobacteria bacterium GWA1_45_9]OFW89702.1 MAG: hypothetical protein A2621_02235 [Alphaproteobacteria bacterium RIFCSPHIGHO2_01_FULL_41_14]OFW96116.1 MAG: hypothetical protein A2977_03605 [Alphaproteobacteria bacterium RIFCSPLOWO2_01_FULL_45_8]HCI49147.1 hypothetical protein [Holosporales bacterium]
MKNILSFVLISVSLCVIAPNSVGDIRRPLKCRTLNSNRCVDVDEFKKAVNTRCDTLKCRKVFCKHNCDVRERIEQNRALCDTHCTGKKLKGSSMYETARGTMEQEAKQARRDAATYLDDTKMEWQQFRKNHPEHQNLYDQLEQSQGFYKNLVILTKAYGQHVEWVRNGSGFNDARGDASGTFKTTLAQMLKKAFGNDRKRAREAADAMVLFFGNTRDFIKGLVVDSQRVFDGDEIDFTQEQFSGYGITSNYDKSGTFEYLD